MFRKLKVGWFSFSCCEDSTIIFTELLNDYYKEWKDKIEFKSAFILQKRSEIKDLDVSFVEGAITSEKQEEQLRQIRMVSKKVVAVGSCACLAMPSGQRNLFSQEEKQEIAPILARFKYASQVRRLSDVITVDDCVSGCPMDENKFLQVLNKYLEEFGVMKR